MNTPTPEQLRLAADIIEKQLPFEVSFDGQFNWSPPLEHTDDPLWWMSSTNGTPHIVRPIPEPEYVPLEAADVPPGSALKDRPANRTWGLIRGTTDEGITRSDGIPLTFEELFQGTWQILRPGSPNWEPCRKLKGGKP